MRDKDSRLAPAAPEPLADGLFDPCVKCTICIEACPVAAATDAFPGPKMAGPDSQRFRGRGERAIDSWIDLCSSCRSCQTACPSNVPIADMNLLAKERLRREHGASLATLVLSRAHLVSSAGSLFAPLANAAMRSRAARSIVQRFAGIAADAPIPPFSFHRFSWGARRRGRARPVGERGPLVALFHGCHVETSRPDLGRLFVALLERVGCRVEVPRQRCCGVALIGSGDLGSARRLALRNLARMAAAAERADHVVFVSPSCQLALTVEYPEVLGLDGARVFVRKGIDLLTLLEKRIEEEGLDLAPAPARLRVAYHTACHLKALGVGLPAVRLLARVPGVEVHALDAGCCGLAGTFGMKAVHRRLALEIGQAVAGRVHAVRPDRVASECEGCRMMIESMTSVRAVHPAEVLAPALGLGTA